jgi:hypothetical protein
MAATTLQEPNDTFLDDTELDSLVEAVHAGRLAAAKLETAKRGRAKLELAVDLGQEAVLDILDSVQALIHREVEDAEARHTRRGGRRGEVAWEDLESTATTAAISAISEHELAKGSVFLKVRWAVRDALESVSGETDVPRSWRRLGRIAWAIRGDMAVELDRAPTMGELHEAVSQRCRNWAVDHLTEDEQKLSGDALEAAITERVSRSGMAGALADLPRVLLATGGDRSLDEPGHGGAPGLSDRLTDRQDGPEDIVVGIGCELAPSVASVLGDLEGKEREAVVLYLSQQGEDSNCTYQEIAAECGVETLCLKRAVRHARARATAPHAQFAYLSGEVTGAFEEAGMETTAKLIRRKAAAGR